MHAFMLRALQLVAVSHGEVWLCLVEHFLELGIGLQLSLVVISIVAHLIYTQMSKQHLFNRYFTQSEAMGD